MKPVRKRSIPKPANASPEAASEVNTGITEGLQQPQRMTPQAALEVLATVCAQVSLPFESSNPQQLTHKILQQALDVLARSIAS